MKSYKLPTLNIPDTWINVQAFCDWYMENNMPTRIPSEAEVFCSDDATAICLFRHGQFQVELYLVHPKPLVQIHEHPYVEVIKMSIVDGVAIAENTLQMGQSHGDGMRRKGDLKGFPLIAFQHWKFDKPTTVASAWKGKTVGLKHEALIKRFHPNSLILNGYADITKPSNYLEALKNGTNS
jgi:hypothetical protein